MKPLFLQRSVSAAVFAAIVLHLVVVVEAQQPKRGPGAGPDAMVKNWLKNQDSDRDGKIAAGEASGLMKRFFQRNDANGDGFLDKAELKALAGRLGRTQAARNKRRQPTQRQRTVSTRELLKNAPDDVVIEPDIAYRPGESKAWRLDLVRPKDAGNAPRPGIVFVHGGGWRSGDKRTGTFLNGAIDYARKGYVCVTVNYRLTGEAPFPACIEDVKCAVRWFRAHAREYNLDPGRLGGFGNSAGAHLVAVLGLVRPDAGLEGDGPYQDQSSLLQAVCASATPTDFNLFERRRDGDTRFQNDNDKRDPETLAKLCSPINHVRKDAPPFLLIHGTADRTVDVKHADLFVKALKEAGAKDVTYIRVDGAGHGVFGERSARTGSAMEAFFARTLRAK